jgi:hypothetical protein
VTVDKQPRALYLADVLSAGFECDQEWYEIESAKELRRYRQSNRRNEMNNRKLLELAAKAAGIDWCAYWPDKTDDCSLCLQPSGRIWNPIIDDGDALRLAVKLRLSPMMRTLGCDTIDLSGTAGAYQKWEDDPYAATRRAIVRAAAEIGRSIK